MAVSIFLIVILLGAYNIMISFDLVKLGQQDLIPPYMAAVSSFIVLFFTLLRANGILFGGRDLDMLSALPVKAAEIIGSRFLFLYLLNFLLCALFMLPGGVIWMLNASPGQVSGFLYFLSILFVPLIPMCAASFTGIGIVFLSSPFRNKNLVSLLFSFAALALIGYAAVSGGLGSAHAEDIGVMLAGQINNLYPLSFCFFYHENFALLWNLLFLTSSVLLFLLFLLAAGNNYKKINTFVIHCASGSRKKKERLKKHSLFAAMYRKEFGRFFSSYMCVLNTGLGVVLLWACSILLCFLPLDTISSYTGIVDIPLFLRQFSPFLIASLLTISCPAASSVSLEGKNLWIVQSAPLPMRTFLNSKIAVNLTLHAAGYVPAVCVFLLLLDFSVPQIFVLLLLPAAYSVFTSVQGIYMNCRFPVFEWDNEMAVVKQSGSVILSCIVGMSSIALPLGSYWFFSFPLLPLCWITITVLLLTAGMLYRKACRIRIW